MPTDAEVGAREGGAGKKRELVKFEAEHAATNSRLFQAFDEEEEKAYVPGSFDQYRERGITSGYKEEYYTTRLNHAEVSSQELREAQRIEADILRSRAKNRHVAQERGQAELEDQENEEEAFSNVIRK